MSNFLKKIVVFLGVVTVISATISLTTPNPTYAETFLGMPPWNEGVNLDGINSEDQLVTAIAKIATNILTDITVIAGYLILGYVIWGGYLYMFSSGDSGKAANGKKTLVHAFTGIAIVICAYIIFSSIRIALIGSGGSLGTCVDSQCVDPESIVSNVIGWVGGMAGAVCAIFVVVGAWGYITASGDPTKLQKAKTTIIYALIGLLIVAFAEILTAFITSTIRSSSQSSLDSKISININKEENEII